MATDPAALVETLKAKATLLIHRERELFELRQERRRTEEWLRAFHALSPELQDTDMAGLIARWSDLLVGSLSFESAGALEYEAPSGRVTMQTMDPGPPPALTHVEAEADALFRAKGSGRCDPSAPPELRRLADAIGLEEFLWLSSSVRRGSVRRGSRLLLFAGSSPRTAKFHRFSEEDQNHFMLLGNHLAALVNNSILAAQVERERTEIVAANRELDASLRELSKTQRELIASTKLVAETSRRAGMADIAAGVLHNVGNVLTSINVGAELVAERLRASRVGNLGKLVRLLEAEGEGLPASLSTADRASKILNFVRELSAHLATERDEILAEVTRLQEYLSHLKAIVNKQQSYATAIGVTELCELPGLVDDAIALVSASLALTGIEIARDYQPVAGATLDRHKALQILVNLVRNAAESIAGCGREGGRIVASIRGDGGARFQLMVEDNGAGIDERLASRLFTQGFTTKPSGHGFGLHTSALAAKEMGGTLTCRSAPGRGAAFILDLPVRPPTSKEVSR
ncbi:sensor histidine kinase [Sorangium sp. So ce341]|uniref:sensor histidine kinase n=1 Tax=Sorangium sp. So ce341 TaxID=3133302 RepID=UPI003F634EFF